jgi:hypothetical protein
LPLNLSNVGRITNEFSLIANGPKTDSGHLIRLPNNAKAIMTAAVMTVFLPKRVSVLA